MIRTIIVDDEILSRIGIQSFIDGEEDVTVTATFGAAADAIEFLQSNPVDIIITDIEMADMNGLEFIQVIREQNLSDGVIIISCHDDFAYAQEAISKGTDSYVLKHNVTKGLLLSEIKKVYGKTHKVKNKENAGERLFSKTTDIEGNGIYVMGVLRVKANDSLHMEGEKHMEGAMLVHLLEGIISRYQMGTLFAPYKKEIFVIFQLPKEMSEQEREETMSANLEIISKNTQQYINGGLLYGISPEFEDLKETRTKYEEAVAAADMSFYEPEKTVFFYRKPAEEAIVPGFSSDVFLEKNGIEVFENELSGILAKAAFKRMDVRSLKEQLIQNVNLMTYQILKEHGFSEEVIQKWNSEVLFISSINLAKNIHVLKKQLTELMGQFRKELYAELESDDFSAVFQYIAQNLKEKITLSELAEISCMSIPSFCKKFKERTGMTLVQYMNEKRIDKAKILLKNRNYSLWQISEATGFSNANYLIRVFKKVTGQTVSEYRKQFGIME